MLEMTSPIRIDRESLTLESISLADVNDLATVATGRIHSDSYMPFGTPWSAGAPEDRAERLRDWYTKRISESSRGHWTLIFSVQEFGKTIGSTNLHAVDYPAQRSVSTGSWLLSSVQGRGVGTQMRMMLLELAFNFLGAERATSEAWKDNIPSRKVNEKSGYLHVGEYEKTRGSNSATMFQYELTRSRWLEICHGETMSEIAIDEELRSLLT